MRGKFVIMTVSKSVARLAVDVGGTFTDVALEYGGTQVTTKVLTTPASPELGVLSGITKGGVGRGLQRPAVNYLLKGPRMRIGINP